MEIIIFRDASLRMVNLLMTALVFKFYHVLC